MNLRCRIPVPIYRGAEMAVGEDGRAKIDMIAIGDRMAASNRSLVCRVRSAALNSGRSCMIGVSICAEYTYILDILQEMG